MFSKLKWSIGVVALVCGSAHAGWFSEGVDLKKFPQAAVENKAFTVAPPPRLKEVKYADRVISLDRASPSVVEEKLGYIKFSNTGAEGSGEDDRLKSSKINAKKPAELVAAGVVPYGTRTSTLGGLFTLGTVSGEVDTNNFKAKPVSYAAREISGISGNLFPLQAGNSFFFSYTLLDDSNKYGATFEVVKKMPAPQFAKEHTEARDLKLIGDIYVITQEIKSTKEDFRSEPCELYYADELSFVIGGTCKEKNLWVKSYKLNANGETYRAEVEASNKAREQEDIDKKRQVSEQLSPELKAKAKEKFTQAFNLFKEGEFEAAVIRFKQGLELDPANGLGHFYMAETYARLNDTENAVIHYNYTVLLTPDIKEAAIAEVKLSKIKEAQDKPQN
jgi:hypothetical protein